MNSNFEGDGAEYILLNISSGLSVARRVRIAGDSASRRRGLLGTHELDPESGLWIRPCEAIHTFGMKTPIDVVFLDRNLQVKKLLLDMPPRRIGVCILASSVVEMGPGAIARSNTQVGDRFSISRARQDYSPNAEQPMSFDSTCP